MRNFGKEGWGEVSVHFRFSTSFLKCLPHLGYVVAQLFETLHYQLEGHRFESLCGLWDFSLTKFFWPNYGHRGE